MSAESVDRFCEVAASLGCPIVRTPGVDEARTALLDLIAGAPALVDETALGALGIAEPADVWATQVGVSEAFAASAESGTVALVHGRGAPRRTAVLPEHHVIVVPAGIVLPTYQAMVDAVGALEPVPGGVQFVSGASRSGDIESAMVKGMHGPRKVTLVVFD